MEKIKDNTVYNLTTIEQFYELEKTRFSKGHSKGTMDFMHHYGLDTCFYFYEDNPDRYYLIAGFTAREKGLLTQTFEQFKEKYL